MKSTGEWVNFFPAKMSPFGINETYSHLFFDQLDKSEAAKLGYNWYDEDDHFEASADMIKGADLPQSMDQVTDDITKKIILCEKTGKPFKVIKQELDLYRKLKVGLPTKHWKVRFDEMLSKRDYTIYKA